MKSWWNKFKGWITSDRVLLILSILLVIFNMIDGGLSWYLIMHLGIGYEANPLMAWLMNLGPEYFLGFKFLIFPPLVYFLYKKRRERASKYGIIGVFALYAVLMLYFAISVIFLLTAGIL